MSNRRCTPGSEPYLTAHIVQQNMIISRISIPTARLREP
jgi:hypothetical protein